MPRWADHEMILLLAFYFRYPRASHTDSHEDCQRLAHAIGRSPGAVDNQLRNIDYDLVREAGDRHVSRRLGQLLDEYKDNLTRLYSVANQVLRDRGWDFPYF